MIACFLVQEGANIHMKNDGGVTAFEKFTPNLKSKVRAFMQQHSRLETNCCTVLDTSNDPLGYPSV